MLGCKFYKNCSSWNKKRHFFTKIFTKKFFTIFFGGNIFKTLTSVPGRSTPGRQRLARQEPLAERGPEQELKQLFFEQEFVKNVLCLEPGVDVMITIFCDFSAKKLAFFLKTNVMINFLKKFSFVLSQKRQFFAKFSAKIFKKS
jgi:hypothetical protein